MNDDIKEKTKGAGLMLLVAIVIIIIGFVAFNAVVGNVGTSGTAQMNATMSTGNTVFSVGGLVLVIGAILVCLGLTYYYVSTPKRYKKVSKIAVFFNVTTYYFGWGLLCFVVIAVPGYLLYLLSQYAVETAGTGALWEVLKWIGIMIAAYFGLAGFGYVMKKKIVDNLRLRRQERKDEEIAQGLDKTLG
jgi:hypothetical protein